MHFLSPRRETTPAGWSEWGEDRGESSTSAHTAGSPSQLPPGIRSQGCSQQNSHIQDKSENQKGQGKSGKRLNKARWGTVCQHLTNKKLPSLWYVRVFLPSTDKSLDFWESESWGQRQEEVSVRQKGQEQQPGEQETLRSILFTQIFPKSRFTEMNYLEMNAQEMAIFTALGCFSHIQLGWLAHAPTC